MRILMLNPNTSHAVTELIAATARAAAAPETEIVAMTAPRGVPYIATRAEAVLGGAVALEMLAEAQHDVDAVVIAAFGDPALGGARELCPVPVIGLAEAGMLTACMLGGRFAVVTFAQALEPWYRECIQWHGLGARCAGVPCRLIAPEPSPCMANAKSASPLCRASVSRIRQMARVSMAPTPSPATAWRSQPALPSRRTSMRQWVSTSVSCAWAMCCVAQASSAKASDLCRASRKGQSR